MMEGILTVKKVHLPKGYIAIGDITRTYIPFSFCTITADRYRLGDYQASPASVSRATNFNSSFFVQNRLAEGFI